MTADQAPSIVLPVWPTVMASLSSVFRHLGNFIGRVWPWVAVVAGATAVLGFGFGMTFEEESAATGLIALLMLASSTMVAVSWHRGLLLGESGGPASSFRLDRPFWRYLGVAIGMTLLIAVAISIPSIVVGVAMAMVASAETATAAAVGLAAVAIVATLPLTSRLLLALPMAAAGAAPPLIKGAWRLGRGNGWRLFGALLFLSVIGGLIQFAVIVPVTLALGGFGADVTALHGAGPNLVLQPLSALMTLLSAGLFASFASYAFAVLTRHPLGRDVTG